MMYALIGERLGHSYSKIIHNRLGNGGYELIELAPDEVAPFLKKADFRGINVTIPYKETVMPFCELDESAVQVGSVNTIINRDGTLLGYNTDVFGFSYMARRAGITFDGKKVLILGSGGTAKTARYVISQNNAAEIVTISRGGDKNYGNIAEFYDFDIIVNTTPVGMYPNVNAAPVSLREFSKLSGVIDVIYNPPRTLLTRQAEKLGIINTNGLPMLAAQAVYAHKLFFDQPFDFTGGQDLIEGIIKQWEDIS